MNIESIFTSPTKVVDNYNVYAIVGILALFASIVLFIIATWSQFKRNRASKILLITFSAGFVTPIILDITHTDTSFILWKLLSVIYTAGGAILILFLWKSECVSRTIVILPFIFGMAFWCIGLLSMITASV